MILISIWFLELSKIPSTTLQSSSMVIFDIKPGASASIVGGQPLNHTIFVLTN